MQTSLGLFTFTGYQPFATKYELNVLEKQPFEHENYDLFVGFLNSYFYVKTEKKIYKQGQNYRNNLISNFPKKLCLSSHTYELNSLSCAWEHLNVKEEIIFICKNHIFRVKVKNVTGYDKPSLDMKNISQEGFYEQFLDFIENLLSHNVLQSEKTNNMEPYDKADEYLKLKISVLKKTDIFGKDIRAYKIKKNFPFSSLICVLENNHLKIKIIYINKLGIIDSTDLEVNDNTFILEKKDIAYFWILDKNNKSIEIQKLKN